MWPWLALVAAIIVGRSVSLQAVLRVIGWAGILLALAIGLLAFGHAPTPLAPS
jgi:hypothetical protein